MDLKVRRVLDVLDERINDETEQLKTKSDFNPDNFALAAGPYSAAFLAQLVRVMEAKNILEIGTSIGYTALWLGEAARAVGGRVVGIEKVEDKYRQAVQNIDTAGLTNSVAVEFGDAKQIVNNLAGPIDLAFIDAWKNDYIDYFDMLFSKIRIGGCIVADNITYPESMRPLMLKYQEYVRSKSNVRSCYLSIGSGLEMSVKI